MKSNRRAALLLALLAPVVAELTLGTVPLHLIWLVLLYVPIYGAGVLLVREVARRAGCGWAGVLLLGLAYGLVEEGLALQSLTSPHLYGAAHWAPRLLGVNTAYTELNLPYHAVFSVTIPIALVELVFSRHGRAPYLRRPGLVVTGLAALLGVALLRVSVPPSQDAGYLLPLPALITIVALIVVLVAIAVRLQDRPRPARSGTTPRPVTVGLACAGGVIGFLGLLYPFAGARQPAFTHGMWVLVPMLAAAGIGIATGLALRHWSATPGWTARHELAAIYGALLAHTAFGTVANAHSPADVAMDIGLGVATAAALSALAHRVNGAPIGSPA